MKQHSFITQCDGKTWKRVSRKTARNRFNNGDTVIICPCNFNPSSKWNVTNNINKNVMVEHGFYSEDDSAMFDKIITTFEYYHCINSETGSYASFYICECEEA